MANMTNKAGSITIEVKPTVTLESVVACVYMLNMFLADNADYELIHGEGGPELKPRGVLSESERRNGEGLR